MTNSKNRRYPLVTIALFALALALLLFGTVGATRAALIYSAEAYETAIHTDTISIALSSEDDVVSIILGEDELYAGKSYSSGTVSIENDGEIDEYVRVAIHMYWADEEGEKATNLDPSLIVPTLADGWIDVTGPNDSKETTVLLYSRPLTANGGSVDLFTGFGVKGDVEVIVEQTEEDGLITTEYIYDGKVATIDLEVSGVQTHNAADAILSAWGLKVSVSSDGTLS